MNIDYQEHSAGDVKKKYQNINICTHEAVEESFDDEHASSQNTCQRWFGCLKSIADKERRNRQKIRRCGRR